MEVKKNHVTQRIFFFTNSSVWQRDYVCSTAVEVQYHCQDHLNYLAGSGQSPTIPPPVKPRVLIISMNTFTDMFKQPATILVVAINHLASGGGVGRCFYDQRNSQCCIKAVKILPDLVIRAAGSQSTVKLQLVDFMQ